MPTETNTMVIPFVAVGDKIKASIINRIIALVNGTALNGIVPTSVVGDTVTVSPNGSVTFTAAYTVSLNGVFSGSYDNYRITWNSPSRSASGSTQFHLRAAGTDASANYDFVKGVDGGTSRTVTSSSSSSAVPLDPGIVAGQTSDGVIDLFNPAIGTLYTAGTAQSAVLASGVLSSCQVAFANESHAAYDGFTLFPLTAGSTWSGTVRVYGYNTLT